MFTMLKNKYEQYGRFNLEMPENDRKVFGIYMEISEYRVGDEGFYHIKKDFEIGTGKFQLLESVDVVTDSIKDFIKRRIKE